ncbi:hypothetical protein LPJ53_000902 [Coemansia erecta]|uniref:Myb-like domain-containing protein n=1 Tax=Coemansia erecta TaxID=147472 RepID=A0A9W7Y143_9FUNG|nr:hypothetical protein LPJ53_000902 [Coemansia erecta]
MPVSAAELGPSILDAEDNLIQELLAGIPSTAWLPTDPLTSEGWFTDPMSSIITHDNLFQAADQPSEPGNQGIAMPASSDFLGKDMADLPQQPTASTADPTGLQTTAALDVSQLHSILGGGASAAASGSDVGSSASTGNLTNASTTANRHRTGNTPDSRLIAAVRSKRDSKLASRGKGSQKHNPLNGFAKKHGIGYPVGGQMMAYLSPALLSSSPPNAKQLRTNPYKYYSPPKPTSRAKAVDRASSRNLMLGAATPAGQSKLPPPPSSVASSVASSAAPLPTPGTAAKARVSGKGVRWEIAQDKLLLHGVRQRRWINGVEAPRDPGRFAADDWDAIAARVAGGGIERSARQCRRRWAVMHTHLGEAIMDFVDSTATPQSSVQSTPDNYQPQQQPQQQPQPQQPQSVLGASDADQAATSAIRARNLRLADLPVSSPPFMPAFARVQGSESGGSSNVQLSSPAQHPIEAHQMVVHRSPRHISLESVDPAGRWQSAAYCQLLADVVQAMSDPQSQAAEAVRKYSRPAVADRTAEEGGIPAVSLPEVGAVVVASAAPAVSDSILVSVGIGDPSLKAVMLPGGIGSAGAFAAGGSSGRHSEANMPKPPLVSSTPTAAAASQMSIAGSLLPHDLDIGNADPDWDIYNQFLQSLGSTQLDLSGDWSNIFGGTAASSAMPQSTAGSVIDLGDVHAIPSIPASKPSAVDISGILTSQPVSPSIDALAGISSRAAAAHRTPSMDDDDVSDDDFVLEEYNDGDEDEYDDEDDEDVEVEVEVDDDESDGANEDESDDTTGQTAAGASSAWDATLSKLGLDFNMPPVSASMQPALDPLSLSSSAAAAALAAHPVSQGVGSREGISAGPSSVAFAPDPLIQQLLQGAADISSNKSSALPEASHSAWLSNAIDSTMLPQWNSTESPSAGLDLDSLSAAVAPAGKQSGKKAAPGAGAAAGSKASGKASRQSGGRAAASLQNTPSLAPTAGAADVPSDGRAIQRQASHQSQLQQLLLTGDGGGGSSRRESLKTPRKRFKKKSAPASIVKAISAAAMIDMDGLLLNDSSVMDTEMSGLYQDALQEGEELDVQEESLLADNSEYLFSLDQMRELREQQVQNFQIVTQALLMSCAEVGPHEQRSRHWKRQMDQLALWHSLGTRESPSDLMSKEGLCRFAPLLESAERVREQSGAVGMTAVGRFAPNPASFFAIPGITAVIPDIYEAVDEIHRATLGCADEAAAAETETEPGTEPAGAPEVRSFDGGMEFTPACRCTAVAGFKSAMMIQCVFPMMYIHMRNSGGGGGCGGGSGNNAEAGLGKRRLSEAVDAQDGRQSLSAAAAAAGGSGSNKQSAISPRDEEGSGGLLQPAGVKPLKPLVKPVARQQTGTASSTRDSASGSLALMPMTLPDGQLPVYTADDVVVMVSEMRAQISAFKRDLHRVARSRRRIFVQGDNGVPRLEWMQVRIEPLGLPPAMQCLLALLIRFSGFRESIVPRIVVVRKPKNRIHFLDAEDTLLLRGLRLFGVEDVASIRVHLMPCKTASQLRNRINNKRARRAKSNPVKDFCLRRIAPFTLEEEEVLRLGVLVFGDEFSHVNQNFLVNRPILALSHVWNHMRGTDTLG